ncbi:hypothetical protein MRB53_032859 [Persea americana]|uniref:Uncharacterized protein n=1 Tax=Persea americana TaxID=3435 RepID=A0ACC2KU83_PERAE|nr:hypothetical protein MRB53_032859 [Persea americana]
MTFWCAPSADSTATSKRQSIESLSENPRWSRQETLLAALPTLVDPAPELELSIAGAVSSLSRSIFVIPQGVPTLIPVEEIASLEPGH